ncbi:hypothetical protein GQ54DRAFT_165686 [Martensiomyces pterosporus]|nr:hypothetical protein GQ54DRAFT_165686 [Martensiomyces pterosporus]
MRLFVGLTSTPSSLLSLPSLLNSAGLNILLNNPETRLLPMSLMWICCCRCCCCCQFAFSALYLGYLCYHCPSFGHPAQLLSIGAAAFSLRHLMLHIHCSCCFPAAQHCATGLGCLIYGPQLERHPRAELLQPSALVACCPQAPQTKGRIRSACLSGASTACRIQHASSLQYRAL